MTNKFILTLFLIVSFVFSIKSSPVKFYSINSMFGISTRVTNSICKDDNGFIWASSKIGIMRLTDEDYHIYQLPYETAGALIVRLIYEQSKLIAYTNNGQIFVYNTVYDRFDLLINLSKTLQNSDHFDFYSILIDKSGDFWIALNSGLYRYHEGKLMLVNSVSNERYSIDWFDNQQIIIAKSDGIWLLETASLKSRCLLNNSDITPFLVSSLYMDRSKKKLWIGTLSKGLFCFDSNTTSLRAILPSSLPTQPVLAIEEISDSMLLIGIDGQGVWQINESGTQVVNVYKENVDDPYSLHGNGVYDIYYERGKRVWIATISGGISFYELASPLVNQVVHHANDFKSLVNNDVNGILEDREGKIWFATNNGISCWNVKLDTWKNFYFNNLKQAQVFLTLCEDSRGRIWAGSYSSGIYVLDGKSGQELAHYTRTSKDLASISEFIFDITMDSQGDLWLGGINGNFVCYRHKEEKFVTYSEVPISSITELSSNQIIIGCSYGISLLNKETGDLSNFLSGCVVQDILVVADVVWVCTSGEGLLEYHYKTGKLKKHTTHDGLPSNFVNSIAFADNSLWIGTESGLCRFNPNDNAAYTFSSNFQLSRISYNKSAFFQLRNGQLAWGTNNGAIFFEPQTIREISSKGKIFFQDLTISGRSIRETPSITLNKPVDSLNTVDLKYSQNTISLELISLGMQSGAKFSWLLDGFDKSWTTPSDNSIITYTNIPSGKFELKIRMYDSSLADIITERSIAFNIVPPFWRTSWFLAILIIVVTIFMLLYFLYYINKLKQVHTEEKVRFFTNTAHDIRTSLTLIKAPVEELCKEELLTDSGKYNLNLALDQTRQLTSVVTQLMDFQKVDIGKEQVLLSMTDIVKLVSNRKVMLASYSKVKNINLVFVSNCESYVTAVDEPKMEKIIDNLISNAIKYSAINSQIQIDLRCEEKKWTLVVKDNGIGISRKAQRQLFKEFYRGDNAINSKVVGSGIGLLLVKNYVTMHGGTISCSSQESIGSAFQIVIPYKVKTRVSTASLVEEIPSSVLPMIAVSNQKGNGNESHAPKEMKVLIVEDNDDLLNFIKNTLSAEFKIYTASNGEQAWSFILKQIPDMVVSDIMMPRMDGFELCKLMKSTYETSHIPILLLTALSEKTDQLRGLGLGADDYLTKPFDMVLLIQKIKSIVRNREAVRDKALRLIKGDSSEQILDNELNDKFVRKMMEVAKANLANSEFDKDEFAAAMNVSSSLLYKKTKALTDQSPTDFIKSIRLNYAVQLLQEKKYNITEVSELCGFTSLTYFGIVFKKQFGKSPSEIIDSPKS